MSRSAVCFALSAGIFLAGGAGCFKADVRVPDVQINTPSEYGGSSPRERRTPYARELEKVIRQQSNGAKNLQKRDWEELSDALGDWTKSTRKLMGQANTSANPARMKEYCTQLLGEIQILQGAAQARDAKAAQAALDRTGPWLNRLSSEFPLKEPVPGAPSPGEAKAP